MAGVSLNIHASCVRLSQAGMPFGAPPGCGVLLLGRSGAGKSDLALRLIAMGAELVADDRTDLFVRRGKLYARPPAPIAGLIEVRGVGIIRQPYAREAPVTLVAVLGRAAARLPEHQAYRLPPALAGKLKTPPPALRIAPFELSAPAKIAAAAAAYALGLHNEGIGSI